VVLPWTLDETPREGSILPRLAVLPLKNISPDPNDEYFADGLTEELITTLAQLQGLRVIALTSVLPYKSAPRPIAQIGAELGVGSVLDGSVRKAGDQLRITVQLVDVASQSHAWAGTYDRKLDSIFAVQTEVATRIAEALKVTLGRGEVRRLTERPVASSESYLAYLRGRTLLDSRSMDDLHKAKEEFERAVSLDSKNAAAYSGLSDVVRLVGSRTRSSPLEDWDEESRRYAERAVELDPNLAEAHTSLGYSLWSDYRYAEAEKEFKLATSLSPSYAAAHQWYGGLLMDEARTEESRDQLALAVEADPRSVAILAQIAWHHIMLRRLDSARAEIERLGNLEGRGEYYHSVRTGLCLAESDYPSALQEVVALSKLRPGSPENDEDFGLCYARMGERERAADCLHRLETMEPDRRPNSSIAAIYAALGDLDRCFVWLNRSAFESYDLDISLWRNGPQFEVVRRDPRFPELLKKMNLA
jgi:TolB-like protein